MVDEALRASIDDPPQFGSIADAIARGFEEVASAAGSARDDRSEARLRFFLAAKYWVLLGHPIWRGSSLEVDSGGEVVGRFEPPVFDGADLAHRLWLTAGPLARLLAARAAFHAAARGDPDQRALASEVRDVRRANSDLPADPLLAAELAAERLAGSILLNALRALHRAPEDSRQGSDVSDGQMLAELAVGDHRHIRPDADLLVRLAWTWPFVGTPRWPEPPEASALEDALWSSKAATDHPPRYLTTVEAAREYEMHRKTAARLAEQLNRDNSGDVRRNERGHWLISESALRDAGHVKRDKILWKVQR